MSWKRLVPDLEVTKCTRPSNAHACCRPPWLFFCSQTWSEGSFGAEDEGGAADDWGDGGMGDDMEGTGGGVVGTLKKIYSIFGGGND